jgi:hypothetical protein
MNEANSQLSDQTKFTKGDNKMFKRKLVMMALVLAIVSSLLIVGIASAHNAGHIILPDGTCLNVGSLKEAPYVSESNPHLNTSTDPGKLDLIPGSGDQYGARFAATRGNTLILPGECP